MKVWRKAAWLVAFSLWLSGCALPGAAVVTPTASPPPVETVSPPLQQPLPTATATPTASGPQTLRLWLPPRFAPDEETPGGALLQARLDAWQAAHPNILLDVRIKAEEGPANMLDALQKTAAAAPSNLPDLVILRRSDLEAAAASGLLHPLDGLTLTMEDPDWFPVAQDLGTIQNTRQGLPLALDTLVLVYRTDAFPEPPQTWQDFSQAGVPVLFPAQDPRAWFPFLLYQSYGGLLQQEGQPGLDDQALTRMLQFFAEGVKVGWFSSRAVDFSSHQEVWDEYLAGRQRAVVVWLSDYLRDQPASSAVLVIPGGEGQPVTLADGWVLALAGDAPEHQAAAIRLAEYLTEGDFLAEWTQAVGLLPPRPLSVSAWDEAAVSRETLGVLGSVAWRIPLQAERDALALRLQQAVLETMQGGGASTTP